MNSLEEQSLFQNTESDHRITEKQGRRRERIDSRLRDRRRKRQRHLKKGHTNIPEWLAPEALAVLEQQIREIDAGHGRSARRDRVNRQDARSLKPVALKHLTEGAIVDAWVPYADGTGYKRRPAVVITADKFTVTAFPLTTSKRQKRRSPSVDLVNWEQSRLSRPCALVQRRVTMPRTDILSVDGELVGDDRAQFYMWANMLNPSVEPFRKMARSLTNVA